MTKNLIYGNYKDMKINLNDRTLIMEFENPTEEKLIKNFVTYKDTSKCFAGGRYRKELEKKVCLGKVIQEKYFVVFSGLTKEILVFCKENNIRISSVEDKRTHFDFQKKEWTHDELREFFPKEFNYVEHQINALQQMIKTNTGLIVAATSAGKSSIIKSFIKLTGLPTLILVDRSTLGKQLRDDLVSYGLDCGFCGDGKRIEGYNMVSTIQSVKKVPNMTSYKCLVIDEVHKSSSNSFQEFLKQFGCPLKFGFTASPYNGDYLKYATIRQFFGSPLIKIGAQELMENGVMAHAKINLVKNVCEEIPDYVGAYDYNITHGERRNQKIADIANSYKDGIAILVRTIDHGEELMKLIPDAVFIRGETSLNDRMKIIKDFNEGKIRVLIGSGILNEGISISNMKVLIMASSGKAISQTIQKIGRVLRITKDKKEGIFYDFIDTGNKILEKQSKNRLRIYKKEGYDDIHILDENLEEIKLDKKSK